MYIKAKQFRDLAKKDLKIIWVFWPYRSWWIKVWDKFLWRTFKYSSDDKLMEQKWDSVNRKFELIPFSDIKVDRDFFKTYKKVFDVKFQTSDIIEMWDQSDNMFIVQLSAYKLQEILRNTVVDDVPVNEEWNEKFDWEDDLYMNLINTFIKFNVTGTWLDTKYTFKSGKEFSDDLADISNIPF